MPGAYDEPEYEIHDTLRSAGTVPPSTIVPIVDARHIEKTAGACDATGGRRVGERTRLSLAPLPCPSRLCSAQS